MARQAMIGHPLAWLAGLLLWGCTSTVETQLETAMLEMRQGAYANAVPLFAEVLEAVPDAPNVHNNMGYALLQLGRYDEALQHFEIAASHPLEGNDAAALQHNWGNALAKVGELDAAVEKYRNAAQADPGRAPVFVNWGNVLNRLEDLEGAEQRYAEALAQEPELTIAWFNRGNVLERLQRPTDALDSYQRFLRLERGGPTDLREHARRFVAQAEAAGYVAPGDDDEVDAP